jgi:hypothetical protein
MSLEELRMIVEDRANEIRKEMPDEVKGLITPICHMVCECVFSATWEMTYLSNLEAYCANLSCREKIDLEELGFNPGDPLSRWISAMWHDALVNYLISEVIPKKYLVEENKVWVYVGVSDICDAKLAMLKQEELNELEEWEREKEEQEMIVMRYGIKEEE